MLNPHHSSAQEHPKFTTLHLFRLGLAGFVFALTALLQPTHTNGMDLDAAAYQGLCTDRDDTGQFYVYVDGDAPEGDYVLNGRNNSGHNDTYLFHIGSSGHATHQQVAIYGDTGATNLSVEWTIEYGGVTQPFGGGVSVFKRVDLGNCGSCDGQACGQTQVHTEDTTVGLDVTSTYTKRNDKRVGGLCPASGLSNELGMAHYSANAMTAGLVIEDTPFRYTPARGPAIEFTVTYNQYEDGIPTDLPNLGPKWGFSWLSYINDHPNDLTRKVRLYTPGGGIEAYSGFDSGSTSQPDPQSHAVLVRVSNSPIKYEKRFPDGSIAVYAHPDNLSSTNRRVLMTEFKDPAGRTITFNYESETSMKMVSVTDDVEYSTNILYEDSKSPLRITGIQEPQFTGSTVQRRVTLSYSNDRLSTIEDEIGIQSVFAYKSENSDLSVPRQHFIQYLQTPYGTSEFDTGTTTTGRWLTMKDPELGLERVEYASTSSISGAESVVPSGTGLTITNSGLDTTNTFYWDKKYTEDSVSWNYSKARITHWALNSHETVTGIVASEKQPLENRVWYNYDGQTDSNHVSSSANPNRIARLLDNANPSTSSQIWRYEYNNSGNITKVTDPTSHVTTYSYEGGNDADLTSIRQKTGSNNDLVRSLSYNGHQIEYDTDAAGQTTHYTYNSQGQILEISNPNGEVTKYGYDRDANSDGTTDGYLTSITSPTFNSSSSHTTFGYDDNQRVNTVTTNPDNYTITTEYDDLDRPTQITYPDTTTQLFFYSQDFGQTDSEKKILDLTTSIDRRGYVTTRRYTPNRQIDLVTEQIQGTTTRSTAYDWCKCGALASITDPDSHTTTFLRDLQSRVFQKVFQDTKTIDYLYAGQSSANAVGTSSRLKSMTDAKNQVTNYSYLIDDNLQQISYTVPTGLPATPSVTFSYADPSDDSLTNYNRLTKMHDATGDTICTYYSVGVQGANQLHTVDGPLPNSPADDTIYYEYDKLGRLTKRTINGVASTMPYDSLGRPSTTTNALGAFTRAYDLDVTPRLETFTAPNGQTSNYSYFGVSQDLRLQTLQDLTSSSANVSKFDYTYDAEGQISPTWTKQLGRSATVTSTLTHDKLDRLTGVTDSTPNNPSTSLSYGYDGADNRTSDNTTADYMINSVNQIGLTGYAYDDNGNMTSDGVNTYQWDAANRLLAIIYPEDAGRTEFTYDGLGRRVKLVEKDGDGSVQRTAKFLWDGSSIAEERGSSSVLKRFFPEGVQLPSASSPNAKLFYSKDHLGSIRGLTNENGSLLSTVDYDPYGSISRAPVPANDTSGPGPVLTTVISRVTHSGVGDFDINLPLSGAPGIEMRNGSGNYTLLLTFDQAVSSATATIASGVGSVSGSPSFSGNTVTVQLSGVADRQTVTLELDNVVGAGGTTSAVFAAMSVCIGDANQNGAVTVEDISLVRANSGNAVDNTTFKYDTNHDGLLNSADISQTKSMQAQAASLFPDFAYAGYYYHARSGLYLTMYRAYNSAIGRWISRDPLGESVGLNPYHYVFDNPINQIDALGLLTVHYWPPNGNQGHLSMTLENGTYISFWPASGYLNLIPGEIRPPNFQADRNDEFRRNPQDLHLDFLDEERIQSWWNEWQKQRFQGIYRNCSTTVAKGLEVGGLVLPPQWVYDPPTTWQDINTIARQVGRDQVLSWF